MYDESTAMERSAVNPGGMPLNDVDLQILLD